MADRVTDEREIEAAPNGVRLGDVFYDRAATPHPDWRGEYVEVDRVRDARGETPHPAPYGDATCRFCGRRNG